MHNYYSKILPYIYKKIISHCHETTTMFSSLKRFPITMSSTNFNRSHEPALTCTLESTGSRVSYSLIGQDKRSRTTMHPSHWPTRVNFGLPSDKLLIYTIIHLVVNSPPRNFASAPSRTLRCYTAGIIVLTFYFSWNRTIDSVRWIVSFGPMMKR